jgi:hypothetical protein
MEALGRLFDISAGIVPVNLATAANTGKRVHLKDAGGVTIVGYLAAGTAAEAPTFDLQEHNAASGGTSQDLDIVDHYYVKAEATLDGDETWTRETQSAASEVTDADWDDANQVIVVIEVDAAQLSDGFEWVSVDVADVGTSHIGCVLYILRDLAAQRSPANLAAPQ